MFCHPEQIAASFDSKVKLTNFSGWRTTMKTSFLVSFGAAIGMLATTAAFASTVTTEHGRPLLVEAGMSVAACGDIAFGTGTDTQSWHDALASKRADDLVVPASWQDAMGKKRMQDRAVALAASGSATGCALTN
jgi:hypothetical protein